MDRTQLMLVGFCAFLAVSDLWNAFTPAPSKPRHHHHHHHHHSHQHDSIPLPKQVLESAGIEPLEKVGGAGAAYGAKVHISFCSSCSYRSTALTIKKMLETAFPGIDVVLSNYPPALPKRILSKLVPGLQVGSIVFLVAGDHIFPRLGYMVPPPWYYTLKQKRFGVIATTWLLGNALQSFLQNTGAFEVEFDGELAKDNNKEKKKGKALVAVVAPTSSWVIDFGASHHMGSSQVQFSSTKPCSMSSITLGDDTSVAVARSGSVEVNGGTFNNVLSVPTLSTNLLSVYQITHIGKGVRVEFNLDSIIIRELHNDTTVAEGRTICKSSDGALHLLPHLAWQLNDEEFIPNSPTLLLVLFGLGGHYRVQDDSLLILVLYVDDLLIIGSSSSSIAAVKEALHDRFSMIDLGLLHYFLGIQISQLDSRITIAQNGEGLQEWKIIDLHSSKTTLSSGKLTPERGCDACKLEMKGTTEEATSRVRESSGEALTMGDVACLVVAKKELALDMYQQGDKEPRLEETGSRDLTESELGIQTHVQVPLGPPLTGESTEKERSDQSSIHPSGGRMEEPVSKPEGLLKVESKTSLIIVAKESCEGRKLTEQVMETPTNLIVNRTPENEVFFGFNLLERAKQVGSTSSSLSDDQSQHEVDVSPLYTSPNRYEGHVNQCREMYMGLKMTPSQISRKCAA
ncbi:hypothetical protein KI387_015232 [Taxus chinensis]|uniref:Uncharacterized protein n=1 Tax=Taxus chinensis TaxID=29808 RepID=A0AA38GFS0_TAXCH|nr:hypothetical protein KI387_015232 [Taxus chinensis]